MILYALPWNLDAPGGINSVVRELIRSAKRRSNLQAGLLVADYAFSKPRSRHVDGYTEISARVVDPFHGSHSIKSLLGLVVRWPMSIWRLAGLFSRLRPIAVNAHYPGLWCITLLAGVRMATRTTRVVLSFHGADVSNIERAGSWRRLWWRFLLRRVDAITVCSEALNRRLRTAIAVPASTHVTVAPNGIDCLEIDRALATIPSDTTSPGSRRIVSVGTFEPKKGHDLLLRAFRDIAVRHADVTLLLVGRATPWRETLVNLARELGIGERVTFVSNASHGQALAAIRDSSLFVLPSREEPFGIVLLEAAYLNVPIVATRVGGIPEILRDQEDALLVPAEDPTSIREAIDSLLNDRAWGVRLSQNAHRRVIEAFQFENTFSHYCRAAGIPMESIMDIPPR